MAFEVEQLFKAVDIILNQRLQDVNFDKTIICTIVDDSDKKNGCYVVSDGTIKFKAYVSDATYKKDDQVRVSVLGGDFSEKKFITGRYTGNEDSSPITYKSPLESIIPITGNLVTETKYSRNGVNSLRANSKIIQQDIWRIDLTSNSEFRDLQSNGIYNTLTIKADFKTLLSHYDLVSGNYGLRLDLLIQPSFDNPTQRIRKYVTLDSSEMMGNPYSFSVYSAQAKKVDIVSTGVIAEMVLWFYQSINGDGEGRRFIDRNGVEIPVNEIADDILVKNIEIGFGSDIEKVSDNTLEIFSSSPPYYVYQDPSDTNNKKEIEMLWYNKTENNEYVGFSDGLYDLEYDEIEYLKKSNQDSRLIAQVGRTDIPNDESGLKLAADLKDAKPIMIKARDALTSNVADVLFNLQRQVKGAGTILTELDNLLDTVNGSLVLQWNAANEAIENWNNSYVGGLQYAYNKQNNITPIGDWNELWSTNDYYKNFVDAIELGVKKVRDFFNWLDGQTQPSAAQSGFRGDYDLYLYRTENELSLIEDWLDQLDALLEGNHDRLKNYHNDDYKFYEYQQKDFSAYANKYCVYWYRYEQGYKLEYQKDANNDEFNFGKFMTDGWRRMDILDADGKILLNFGLPREGIVNEKDGKTYYPAKAIGQVVSRKMDPCLTEEKYAVILFHNHEMYKSNIITFTNSEPHLIPNDALIDKKDALRVEHDVASQEHYQLYNEFNLLRSLEDGGKVRQLKCFYEGLFKGDEALIEAGLYWYVPNHGTMLTFDKADLIKEGFSTDADGATERSIPGYTYFYKQIRQCEDKDMIEDADGNKKYTCRDEDRYFFYKIKPELEKDAKNNTIKVKAFLKGIEEPVEGDIAMTFSTFGTNGTKYTLSIVPSGSQASVGGKDYPLKLSVGLRDSKNNPINIVDSDQVGDNYGYGFTVESWKGLPNAFTVTKLYDETNTYVKGLEVKLTENNIKNWNAQTPYFGILNAKVNFRINKNEYNEESIEKEEEETKRVSEYQKYRVVDLNTLYAITYSSSDAYYMSGATSIVYNNQGTLSYVSEDEYLLYTVNQKGNIPVPNQVWRMEYYRKDGTYIGPGDEEWPMLENYMPVLNSENRLTPAPLYIQDLDYVPVVICTVNGDFAWVQPIIITQNCYASSTLNDWGGSLTIDEKNGTILSTAVGAGKKDEQNRFWGVLMGDIGKGLNFDSDNMSGLGLYGFHEGAQSFCLSADGTAFFGKAGRGRIYFDGTSGTIASASYEAVRRNSAYPTSAGMMIDLDDGFIHMLGVRKSGADYYPDHPDASSQAEIMLSTTGLLNGVEDAYFKIRSRKQTDLNHYLIFIGGENYYLQTDDYTDWDFTYTDASGELDFTGKGLKLDLKNGSLDAYNFQLSSKNVFINSTDSTSAYFVIKDNTGVNLFYAGPTDYYLKSVDYQPMANEFLGSGIKITLKETGSSTTGIEAYNFDLRAGQTAGGDHEIIVSDRGDTEGNAYFQINTSVGNATKTLVHISKQAQYFQSSDYDGSTTGIALSLSGKELKAFSGFHLKAYSSNSTDAEPKYIEINADAATNGYPLRVADNFKVSWDGTVEASGGIFSGTINATGGTFTGTVNVEGVLSGGTIKGATIKGGTLDIGSGAAEGNVGTAPFHVNADGSFVATSGTIGGWTVTKGSGFSSGGTGGVYVNPTGMGYGTKFAVDQDGNLTATSAVFDTSLTVKGIRNGTTVMEVDSKGNIDLTGTISIKGSYIYLNSAGDKTGCYLYTSGNKFYVSNSTYIYLDAEHVKVGNPNAGIGIGGNPASNPGVTIIYGKVQVNSPEDFVLMNADGKSTVTLANYIKNIGDFDTTTVTANAYFLVSGDGTKTKYDIGSASQPVYFAGGIPVECSIYAPSTKGPSNQVWAGNGNGEDSSGPSWKTIQSIMGAGAANQVWAADASYAGNTQGGTNVAGWKTIYAPTGRGTANQVWTSNGANSNPTWKTIGATLVNFTDTTTVNGPYTSGNTTYYTVKVPYTKNTYTTKEETVEVSTTQYVRFGKPSAATGKVTLYECTYSEAINRDTSVYPYYGVVYSSGSKKVTVINTESSSTAYTTGSVEIQVSLS